MSSKNFQPRLNSIYRILILSLLDDEPRSGYDLIKCLEGILGSKPSHGKVYPFLNELQKFNLIEVEEDPLCRLKSTIVYKLSSEGQKLLANTLGHLEGLFSNFLTPCCHCGIKYYSTRSKVMASSDNYCCIHCKTAKTIRDDFLYS